MKKTWKSIHFLIITLFFIEIIYSTMMVFFVVGGGKWPLLMRAVDTPIEVILKRRLYGIENWIAIGTFCIYLALTEFLPRQLKGLRKSLVHNPDSVPPNPET